MTTTNIVGIQNQYSGFVQLETVTVLVTDAPGYTIDQGDVTFQVNGETLVAPVINGYATVTFATPMLNPAILLDLFFPHALTASYNDGSGAFLPSGAGEMVPSILLDFFTYLIAQQYQELTQYQVV